MIPRYTRPEMAALWEPENRLRIMLEIEIFAAEAMEAAGAIPAGVAQATRERGRIDVGRIDDIERETRHDVIAFLTSIAEQVGDEARWLHQGMTSSDVLDTALAVQLRDAATLLVEGTDHLLGVLERRAREHAATLCAGRSHGIHAEPTTFGLKLAGHHAEFSRRSGASRRHATRSRSAPSRARWERSRRWIPPSRPMSRSDSASTWKPSPPR